MLFIFFLLKTKLQISQIIQFGWVRRLDQYFYRNNPKTKNIYIYFSTEIKKKSVQLRKANLIGGLQNCICNNMQHNLLFDFSFHFFVFCFHILPVGPLNIKFLNTPPTSHFEFYFWTCLTRLSWKLGQPTIKFPILAGIWIWIWI